MADTQEPTPATPAEPTPVPDNPLLNAGPSERDKLAAEVAIKNAARRDFASQRWESQLFQNRRAAQVPPSAPVGGLKPLTNEDDQALYGMPTLRPSEHLTTGANRAGRSSTPPPPELLRNLDAITALAQDPEAPPEVGMLATALAREVEGY